jgi:hypothetical protein
MFEVRSFRGGRRVLLLLAATTAVVAAAAAVARVDHPAAAAASTTAPVYRVVQEGLTRGDAQRVAEAFGLGNANALQPNGAFAYVDAARFGQVPTKTVRQGKDEAGRPIVSEALDTAALKSIRPLADADALGRSAKLLDVAGVGSDFAAKPQVSHTDLTIADRNGRKQLQQALDTTVSYSLTLGGLPATGQGAKLRITYAPDGTVTQLSDTLRKVQRSGNAPIIDVATATAACAKLYAPDVKQAAPTLGYYLPALSATDASGQGTVKLLLPAYTCNPVVSRGAQAHRLLPAVPGTAPTATVTATRSNGTVSASASVQGGTAPYTYRWSSSTTTLSTDATNGTSV